MDESETVEIPQIKESLKDDNNPYAYLDRNDFTSEKYKIEIRGLPKHYGMGEFKKFLNEKLNLDTCKVKPPKKNNSWLYASFRNEESRSKAISTINGISWKNHKLTAQVAKPAPDPFIKRKLEQGDSNNKRSKVDEEDKALSPSERVRNSTVPLWNIPYTEQLELKQKEMRGTLLKMGQQISKENKSLAKWIDLQQSVHHGLLCELQEIRSAELIKGYRNKCEFTIGKNIEGTETIIGFRISSYAAGSTAVGPIQDLCHIPQRMKSAIMICEEFIKKSKYDVFNPVDHRGYWKQVTARTTRCDHLMLIIGMNPQCLSVDELNEIKGEIRDYFENGKGLEARVTSLYFQTISLRSAGGQDGGTIDHLSGRECIQEILLDMTFRVSPEAFFQVNTMAAEILYKTAIELANPNSDIALLDVCCGTGTIGLCFSKFCGEVLGLEMVSNAIKNARENAIKNDVTNCEFFVGKAEDILHTVIQRTSKSSIIAVVDPPRAGLHKTALLALRRAKKLKKLIYIACDPKAAIRNLVDLARPTSKQYVGEPLVPIKAVPVDMFPYTKHCELIICLERISVVQEHNKELIVSNDR
ncbi:tRNA (uracil-5-)-methyltransferase homolog A [Cephus cinctus]|uniref:tRNA (uracil(54)-C(5))-methyltransferase n=1 Tax=Cephus cinctus TaxID=211228 RepID=A0AAJ7CAS3_CEPCN|nr:tRNA (uracil-5-)-methyltransferase homolog A [Cephus cinctus]